MVSKLTEDRNYGASQWTQRSLSIEFHDVITALCMMAHRKEEREGDASASI